MSTLRQFEIVDKNSPRYKWLGLEGNKEYERYIQSIEEENNGYNERYSLQYTHEETEADRTFRKELEKKIIKQVKETTEKEISKVFK